MTDTNVVTFTTTYGSITTRRDRDAKIVAHLTQHPSFFESDFAVMRAFVTKDDEVFDIGANIGCVTLSLARYARRVHAFEPIPATADLLEYNIAQNHLSNVVVNRMGLSDSPGQLHACFSEDAGQISLETSGEGESVPVSTLDAYAASIRVGFIKLDVEGMEAQVLAGGQACITTSRPIIFFEAHTGNKQQHTSFKKFYQLLPAYSFFFNLYETQDGRYQLGKLPGLGILRFASGTLNVLAVPNEKIHFSYVGTAQTLLFLSVRKIKNKLRLLF
ncbi:MAG: FkbM family methyltransferase [bacterium]